MLFKGLSVPEAIFVAALFGVPMVVAVVIFTMISRRRARRLGQNRPTHTRYAGVGRATPDNPGMFTQEEFDQIYDRFGNLIFAVCCFILAPIYSSVVADVESGKSNTVNVILGALYFFCGKDIPVIGFVVAGVFFLVRWLVQYIRFRQQPK